MPRARSAGATACSECASSCTSPETSWHLQVPQLPVWQEKGNGKPGAQQRREQRVAGLRRHGTIVAFDGDLHSPAEPTLRWAGMGAQQTLKPGLLAGLLGYRLRVAQQAVFRDFAREIPEASPGRAGILLLIDANPGVTQSRLAQAVGIDRSTHGRGAARAASARSG